MSVGMQQAEGKLLASGVANDGKSGKKGLHPMGSGLRANEGPFSIEASQGRVALFPGLPNILILPKLGS